MLQEAFKRPSSFDLHDLPENTKPGDWKSVPIQESGQPLVCLNDLGASSKIQVKPKYYILGIKHASPLQFLREEALDRLKTAAGHLPDRMSLVVYDAYRPISAQTEIYKKYRKVVKSVNRGAEESEITRLTEKYVSLPSTNPDRPSPHSTGGAVDLTIFKADGLPLEMGTEWDSFTTNSNTLALENTQEEYHLNRILLVNAMQSAGFTNYNEEWWHYDFGNQFWGFISGKTAIYGIANEGGEINE